jgi:hypothetical protein
VSHSDISSGSPISIHNNKNYVCRYCFNVNLKTSSMNCVTLFTGILFFSFWRMCDSFSCIFRMERQACNNFSNLQNGEMHVTLGLKMYLVCTQMESSGTESQLMGPCLILLPGHSGPWPLIQFRNHFSQTVGLLGRVISPSQGRYLTTGQHNTE